MRRVRILVSLVAIVAAAAFVSQIAQADTVGVAIPVGASPLQEQLSPNGSRLIVSNELANSVSIISTTTNAVLATVPVGTDPGPIRFLPDGSKAYVANFLGDTVSVINMTTNTLAATVTVGKGPITLTVRPDGAKVYVVNEDSNSVSVICTGKVPPACAGTDVLVGSPIQVGKGPWGVNANGSDPSDMAVNPNTNKVYVANNATKNVAVIDGATNAVTAMINLGNGPRGAAVDPGTNRVFISNDTSDTLSVINGATGGIITTFGVGNGPSGLAVDTVTHRVFVANLGTSTAIGNTVSVIDETPGSVDEHKEIALVTVGTGPSSVAADSVTHRVYVSNNGTSTVPGNTVSIIDETPGSGGEHTLIGTVTVGANPRGVAVNPNTGHVYVANGGTSTAPGNTVSIINDSVSPATVSTVTVGSGPSRVGINTSTNKVYVSNNTGPGTTVSVINGATDTVSGTITVGPGPSGVAVNTSTNRIYVGNKVSDDVSVINGATGALTATIGIGSAPHTIAKSPDGSLLYIANQLSNTVTVLSTASDSLVANIPVDPSPGSIHFLPDGRAYIANRGCADSFECTPLIAPTISVINPGSSTVSTTISANVGIAGAAPHAIRGTPNGATLYFINKHTNEVKVISTATNSVTNTIPITTGVCTAPGDPTLACPVRIEITSDGSRVYVVSQGNAAPNGTVSVICTGVVPANCGGFTANTVMATLSVGAVPIDIEIECFSNKAYVSNSGASTVSQINITGVPACQLGTDSDGDGIPDATDNCPNWPNPTQALPQWAVPAGDPDCDGFPTSVETYAGTLALVHCPATLTAHDENPDAWPVDNNDDRKPALSDVIAYIPVFGSVAAISPPYNPRFDINADGKIGLADILKFIPFFNVTCTP